MQYLNIFLQCGDNPPVGGDNLKLKEIMTQTVVKVHPQESVAVAARLLTHYNIGALPVCGNDGKLCGLLTDRDVVTRCMAAGRLPENTKVQEIMTNRLVTASPDMEVNAAAHLMGREQVRRLPVLENGKLCGMVSLGDLAIQGETVYDAGDALAEISENLSRRDSCPQVK